MGRYPVADDQSSESCLINFANKENVIWKKRQYVCPKCGCTEYEADRLQATGGNFAKLFDVQNKKFVTVSCCQCGYTELYKQQGGDGWDVLDFLLGG